ncbi:MAG: alpha/beta fold hydrolase [Alphaproteobacteria bacterium]|nr:alpha/beta fold hydrolase [Alphaproteobacteria bacterium]
MSKRTLVRAAHSRRIATNSPTRDLQAAPPEANEDTLDQRLRAVWGSRTGGASPWAALQAWENWAFHLARSPTRLSALGMAAWADMAKITADALTPASTREPDPAVPPSAEDRRFRDPRWKTPPYDTFRSAHLAAEAFWRRATQPLPGVNTSHLNRVRFMGEQALHAVAPSNFAWTNPQVADAILHTGGKCLADGFCNYWDDVKRAVAGERFFGAEDFEVGRNLAITPGKVVFRNDLIELLQYAPRTPRVRSEPILIAPAWIMKYYVLDLSPENSLIRHLVDQGFTVFCISWKNPTADDRDLALEDYRTRGVLAALHAVEEIAPEGRPHLVGYCLGGTMAALTAAAIARDDPARLATLSLLAAQTDFSEAGELMMFTDESQIAALEDVMNAQGYLDARQMAGAFYALRANEMLWTRVVERYLAGVRRPATDLDAWLADATRMPARMHSEYLRLLFLENRLAQGRLAVEGDAISLKDIRTPIYAVGAERDHIAPWRSVFKIALFATAGTTFVLSGGGHNSAIVSPPGKHGAYYRAGFAGDCESYMDPEEWLGAAPKHNGSWWPHWTEWLVEHSSKALRPPPSMGARNLPPLADAPGAYVLQM